MVYFKFFVPCFQVPEEMCMKLLSVGNLQAPPALIVLVHPLQVSPHTDQCPGNHFSHFLGHQPLLQQHYSGISLQITRNTVNHTPAVPIPRCLMPGPIFYLTSISLKISLICQWQFKLHYFITLFYSVCLFPTCVQSHVMTCNVESLQ